MKYDSIIKVINLIILIVACTSSCVVFNPVRASESEIRDEIVSKTPIGSSSDQILEYIYNELDHEDEEKSKYRNFPALAKGPEGFTEPVGNKSICIRLKSYWAVSPDLPLITNIWITWAFDDNNRLIEVLVDRENDGP